MTTLTPSTPIADKKENNTFRVRRARQAWQLAQLAKHDRGLVSLLKATRFPHYYQGVRVPQPLDGSGRVVIQDGPLSDAVTGLLMDRFIRGAALPKGSRYGDTLTGAERPNHPDPKPPSDKTLYGWRDTARRTLFRHPDIWKLPVNQALPETVQAYNPAFVLTRLGEMASNNHGQPRQRLSVSVKSRPLIKLTDFTAYQANKNRIQTLIKKGLWGELKFQSVASADVVVHSGQDKAGFDALREFNQDLYLLKRLRREDPKTPFNLDLIGQVMGLGDKVAAQLPEFYDPRAKVISVEGTSPHEGRQGGLFSRLRQGKKGDVLQMPDIPFWKRPKPRTESSSDPKPKRPGTSAIITGKGFAFADTSNTAAEEAPELLPRIPITDFTYSNRIIGQLLRDYLNLDTVLKKTKIKKSTGFQKKPVNFTQPIQPDPVFIERLFYESLSTRDTFINLIKHNDDITNLNYIRKALASRLLTLNKTTEGTIPVLQLNTHHPRLQKLLKMANSKSDPRRGPETVQKAITNTDDHQATLESSFLNLTAVTYALEWLVEKGLADKLPKMDKYGLLDSQHPDNQTWLPQLNTEDLAMELLSKPLFRIRIAMLD